MTEKTDRQKEIIAKAAKLFHERGYSAVSMRDIANALNIKAASLYNHISSKQEILSEIVISTAEAFTRGMKSVTVMKASSTDKLKQLISIHIDITLRNPDAIACLNNDWMHLDKKNLRYFLKMREDYEENFRKILRKGVREKEIKNLNVEIILFSMLSTLRTLHIWYGKRKKIRASELKEDITRVLLKGVL